MSGKRNHVVKIRLSDDELALIDAERGSCPRARYIRGALFRDVRSAMPRRIVIRCGSMDDLVRALNRIGVNVNQLVRLSRGLPVADDAELDAEVLRDGMAAIADALERYRYCNDCVAHNRYEQPGLGDAL